MKTYTSKQVFAKASKTDAYSKEMKRIFYQMGFEEGQAVYRQFILNILRGIDIADKKMGGSGGTKAIRLAIKSKII